MVKNNETIILIAIYFCVYSAIGLILILLFPGEGCRFAMTADINIKHLDALKETPFFYVYKAFNFLFIIGMVAHVWIKRKTI